MLTPVFLFLILNEDSYYDIVTNEILQRRLSKIAYSIEHHTLNREKAISAVCDCSILSDVEADAVLKLLEKECLDGSIQD